MTIPELFGNFTELAYLDLSSNFMGSTIPESIKNLKNLQVLFLAMNQFSGTVPDLRGLTKLRAVQLYSNSFTGPIDTLLQLPAIETIDVSQSLLNSELPSNISRSLRKISLTNSNIYGTIPDTWALHNLTIIHLGQNQLNGTVPCFGPNLVQLELEKNNLHGEFCGRLLRDMQQLMITGNNFSGVFDMQNVNVSNQTILEIDNNMFTSFMPSAVNVTVHPRVCSASNNAFKCPIPDWATQRCQAKCSH